MKVTQVALHPTEASMAAGRPSLTPELLAASGARYSRNNEGLESILERIDPENLDRSVDSIFRMIDYGHQSIADMAPVALFIDDITLWLAYLLWTLCPTAGGQESSTRYIRLSDQNLAQGEAIGLDEQEREGWAREVRQSLRDYETALSLWQTAAEQDPNLARLPRTLTEDPSDRAQRQIARMRRNYAFDRSRYFLPAACLTNVMLIMSARAWTTVCQFLLSHPLPEASQLGGSIRAELALAAPRMLKHAEPKRSFEAGIRDEFTRLRDIAASATTLDRFEAPGTAPDMPPGAFLNLLPAEGVNSGDIAAALQRHDNRYGWVGSALQRTAVRFGWDAVAFAEIRDLNRHRTGTKYCPLIPRGFYAAVDQVPDAWPEIGDRLAPLIERGLNLTRLAHKRLARGDPSYVYWTLLGTQFYFEHTTTADKFLYEAELRTGTGAHYRYARHLHDTLELWYSRYPETKGLILEGSAEPE